MRDFTVREILVHVALVTIFLILLNYPGFDLTIGVFHSGDGSLIWPSITGTLINLIIFYSIGSYLVPEVLRKRGVIVFAVQFTLIFALLTFLEVIMDHAFFHGGDPFEEIISEIIIVVTVFNLLFAILAFAYRFAKDWFVHQRQRIYMSEWQARTELEMLKNQINPHFLFNALNSLFSLSLKSGDDKTAEGIGKLSEMMRYVFDKSKLEKVALGEEIQYLQDYIYLQKLRFEDAVDVQTDFAGACRDKRIAPMILIPFLENAFKHGVSSSEKTKITCKMSCENENMLMVISNQVPTHTESMPSTGVGLTNVKKRLNLIYPDRHELDIENSEGIFTVRLKIEL